MFVSDVSCRGQGLELAALGVCSPGARHLPVEARGTGPAKEKQALFRLSSMIFKVCLLLAHLKSRKVKMGHYNLGDALLPCTYLVQVGSPGGLNVPSKLINCIPCACGCN